MPNSVLEKEKVITEHLHKAFFEGPCKCCGGPDHGVLMTTTGEGGRLRISLACSTSEVDDWEVLLKSGLDSMRFKASFEKFSEANDNNLDRLQVATRQFIKHGEGRHMHYLKLIDFDSDVHRYRRCMHNQSRFKRYVSPSTEEYSSDSEGEPRC